MKRRKVFRVIAVYGAASFVVLEAADVIFPAIPLPDWTISLVLYLLLFGFPIAVTLAWAFELTPDGVHRTAAAAPEEIDSLVAAPAAARWLPGLLALGGIVLLAATFYVGRRSASDPVDVASDVASSAPSGEAPTASSLTYVDLADDPRPAIAVLPFADMSPEGDQEYFSDGISEEIRAVLSRIRDLRVAARSSAFAYKDRDLDLRQVGQELNVPYLLDGSVRRQEDQLRIHVELVDASDGFPVWSETYNRRLENVFAIQTEIAEAVSEALRIPLGLSREALVSPTLDMDAHDLYLSAKAGMRRRGSGVGEAIDLLEAVVAADSMWAPAWASLAEAHAMSPDYTVLAEPGSVQLWRGEYAESELWESALAAAEVAALRALALEPGNAQAHVALGMVFTSRWDWEAGEREYLRALDLDPDSGEAHQQYAELLWGMGRLDESLRETGRALALDRSPIRLDVHGLMLLFNGRADEGEALMEEGIELDPDGEVFYLRQLLSHVMLFDGRYREALDRFAAFLPDSTGYRRMGEALEAGDSTLLPETAGRGWPQALVVLGEPDRSLDAIEEVVRTRPFRIHRDLWDPLLAPIWDTPRFRDVILPLVKLEGARARVAPTSS
ncbi:MAG: hypothetical protein ACC682_16665 [Gemmatimonadota bacterium]